MCLATAVPSGAALLVRHAAGSLLQVKHYLLHQQAAPLSTIPDPDLDELYSLKHEQQQHFVHPVSITQLESMCRNPTLKLLVNSAAFLKSQLPARLQNHLQRLEVSVHGMPLLGHRTSTWKCWHSCSTAFPCHRAPKPMCHARSVGLICTHL